MKREDDVVHTFDSIDGTGGETGDVLSHWAVASVHEFVLIGQMIGPILSQYGKSVTILQWPYSVALPILIL